MNAIDERIENLLLRPLRAQFPDAIVVFEAGEFHSEVRMYFDNRTFGIAHSIDVKAIEQGNEKYINYVLALFDIYVYRYQNDKLELEDMPDFEKS